MIAARMCHFQSRRDVMPDRSMTFIGANEETVRSAAGEAFAFD